MGIAMLLSSALLVIASVVTFAVAWANTDALTGLGPDWTDWLAYTSIAGFCIGCFGVLWALGMALY